MSFILDALKKLEREKQAREPDVVVVGPVPWGGADRKGGRRWLVLSGVAIAAIAGGAAWWLASGSGASPSPPPAAPPLAASSPAAARPRSPMPVATPPSPSRTVTASPPVSRALGIPEAQSEARRTEAPALSEDGSARLEDPPIVTEEVPPARPVADTPEDVEFRLTAISTRDGQAVAILNDRLVREGDAFEDVRILRIGTTEIEIEVGGERRTIGF